MFPKGITIEALNKFCANTAVSHLDIEFTEIGDDFIVAKMPVSDKTKQPFGLLHGGASVLLAESLGSVAAGLVVGEDKAAVGLEISASHIKSAKDGFVFGRAYPVHIGKSTHVWEMRIRNEQGDLITVSKLTVAILDKK